MVRNDVRKTVCLYFPQLNYYVYKRRKLCMRNKDSDIHNTQQSPVLAEMFQTVLLALHGVQC